MRHGFLLIDKPVGPTSHDVVAVVRRKLGEQKIGHLGTLDPLASGLLVLAVGAKALKVIELFRNLPKEYDAEVTLGAVSTTYDREGTIEEITPQPGWEVPKKEDIQAVIARNILGRTKQVPPAYSAVSVGGERAYRKMRQGKSVDLPAREVLITACTITSYDYPTLALHVSCGSGTYIRSLAHDTGQLLRFGGYLSALRRSKVGDWSVSDAVVPEDAEWGHVHPLKDILHDHQGITLTPEFADDVRHGRLIPLEVKPDTVAWFDDLPIAILVPARDGSRQAHARKVL